MTLLVERPVSGRPTLFTLEPAGSGPAAAIRDAGNPLADGWRPPEDPPAELVVLWSGTLSDGLFDSHPRNWLPPGHSALHRVCVDHLAPLRAAGRRVCLRPHCRHVLSDVPSCRVFCAEHDAVSGLALAPAELFEESMLETIEDHLVRIFEGLGALTRVLYLDGIIAFDDAGAIPDTTVVGDLVRTHVPAATPIVVTADQAAAMPAWLETGSDR